MALGATSEDERVALDCRMVAFENRMEEEKWPNLKMVETTPLGTWSGRRRTDLRLVLSSPRDKMNIRRRLLFERRSHAGS